MTENEWFACTDPERMLEFVKYRTTYRKVRLFGVACCRRIWALLPSKQCKAAVDVAEYYAEGRCGAAVLDDASAKVTAAIGSLALLSEAAEYAATAAALVSSRDDVERTAVVAATAGGVRISRDDWEEQRRVEQGQQAALLRDIVGNPFRPATFNPVWRTSDVRLLAEGIYEERAFDRMPILADALQDAGCDSTDLLAHLRDTTATHVRGCWALDLVLGKE